MQIEGCLGHIIYENKINGYTIARLQTEEDNIAIVGVMHNPSEGLNYSFDGDFVVHPKYGEQFAFNSYSQVMPKGEFAIREFLASGVIKGIGKKTADLIVDKFSEDSLRIIEEEPDELLKISGIGKATLKKITESYNGQREFAKIALELEALGISSSIAVKLYNEFKETTVEVLYSDPYVLIGRVRGFNFSRVDAIALKLGISGNEKVRVRAAIKNEIREFALRGNTIMPVELLYERAIALADITSEDIEEEMVALVFEGEVQLERIDEVLCAYLPSFCYAEKRVAHNLKRIADGNKLIIPANIKHLINDAEASLGKTLSEDQKTAVVTALSNNLTVITGGPGTGKTTIINTIVTILNRLNITPALAAPTGRAAKRMEESAGCPAKTIHRLLECVMDKEGNGATFQRNEENPLDEKAIIVDEASMIDINLMDKLLLAVKDGAKVILTGDVDQLPSVGPGNVLHDIITSECFPVIRLNKIYRQAANSLIITNAHRINNGEMPLKGDNKDERDFFVISKNNEEDALKEIKSLVMGRLSSCYDFVNDINDIQILTPTKKGRLGANNLNAVIQEVVNPRRYGDAEIRYGNEVFRKGDRVMHIVNNYDLEWETVDGSDEGTGVFNGEIGIVEAVNPAEGYMDVISDDRYIRYKGELFGEVTLAYATTVHKSQGNEFPAVIIPVSNFPAMLMTRNLLYTGVTRGKKLVIIVGSEKCLVYMINNDKTEKRYTGLDYWIKEDLL